MLVRMQIFEARHWWHWRRRSWMDSLIRRQVGGAKRKLLRFPSISHCVQSRAGSVKVNLWFRLILRNLASGEEVHVWRNPHPLMILGKQSRHYTNITRPYIGPFTYNINTSDELCSAALASDSLPHHTNISIWFVPTLKLLGIMLTIGCWVHHFSH